jgi:hypothetical protein
MILPLAGKTDFLYFSGILNQLLFLKDAPVHLLNQSIGQSSLLFLLD